MDKSAYPYCLYEEGEVNDDAEHTVFKCARWQSYGSVLSSIIGTITAANIVAVMIASRENWGLSGKLRGANSKAEEERS